VLADGLVVGRIFKVHAALGRASYRGQPPTTLGLVRQGAAGRELKARSPYGLNYFLDVISRYRARSKSKHNRSGTHFYQREGSWALSGGPQSWRHD
jgi:hypothetical protein